MSAPKPHPFRYKKLGYIALNVTDIERTHDFAVHTVGLDAAGEGASKERLYRVCADRQSVILHPAKEAGFKRAAWELPDAEEVEKAFAHFSALGWKPWRLAAEQRAALGLAQANAFRVVEPLTGCTFEYYDRLVQVGTPFTARLAKIVRLGHFGIGLPNVTQAAAHFEQHCGFTVSDYVETYAALMRVHGSPLHHSMGLAFAPVKRFNHFNFMVQDIDDIGRALWRLKKHKVPVVFGPGRHPTSDSIFIYFNDPDGLTWEYSFGMELFPEQGARPPRIMSAAPPDIDLWGAGPEPDFGKHGGIEAIEQGA
jgi:2,3-dihydroxy-p-cumate/2,3-dihydroxybenzoate 3,4-dioxygenase